MISDELKAIWRDAYTFWKTNYDGSESDAFWTKLVESADEICKKHGESRFAASLLYACVDDIERRYKNKDVSEQRAI